MDGFGRYYSYILLKEYKQMIRVPSAYYWADRSFAAKTVSAAADRYKITTPAAMRYDLGGTAYTITAAQTIDLSSATTWDTIDPTDYTVAATRAGKDFYIYAVATGFKVSANATVPSGYDADTIRKLGGFHCECAAVGTISGHTLTGYLTGDILPASVWDLKHRPHSNPEGMVYSELADMWVDIYLPSGTGANTASVYNATISDSRVWLDFADDGGAVKKQFLTHGQFQIIAEGSNQKTNISGSADPVTTGAHVDTAARRMVSNIGCEDCCGAMYQFLADQHMNWDLSTSTSLGSQLLTNPTFPSDLSGWIAGAGWAYEAGGGARHTAGDVETLAQSINLTAAKWYKVLVIISGRTEGSISESVGATTISSGLAGNTTYTKDYICPSTAAYAIAITPTTDFNGKIAVVTTAEITFGWLTLAGNKGSLYCMGAIADGKMVAGGHWGGGAYMGSRCRSLVQRRLDSGPDRTTRFCSKPINK